jgi:hypothetical protein
MRKKVIVCFAGGIAMLVMNGCASIVSGNQTQTTTISKGIHPNAYGLGIHSDEYGRPVKYQVQGEPEADTTLLQVKQDAYGPGVGMDQYGRPVKTVPAY